MLSWPVACCRIGSLDGKWPSPPLCFPRAALVQRPHLPPPFPPLPHPLVQLLLNGTGLLLRKVRERPRCWGHSTTHSIHLQRSNRSESRKSRMRDSSSSCCSSRVTASHSCGKRLWLIQDPSPVKATCMSVEHHPCSLDLSVVCCLAQTPTPFSPVDPMLLSPTLF